LDHVLKRLFVQPTFSFAASFSVSAFCSLLFHLLSQISISFPSDELSSPPKRHEVALFVKCSELLWKFVGYTETVSIEPHRLHCSAVAAFLHDQVLMASALV
jgi:hypothetical protein